MSEQKYPIEIHWFNYVFKGELRQVYKTEWLTKEEYIEMTGEEPSSGIEYGEYSPEDEYD